MRQRLGTRPQKLALDVGLSCPNRDGNIAYGGCTFCLNKAFSPSYCREHDTLLRQIDRAIEFHALRRRTSERYIAYLQSGSNTYAPIEKLEEIYKTILSHPRISGIIVGTRPDCISPQKLDLLEHISHSTYVAIEYGIESLNDHTLRHVNRGHDTATTIEAIEATRARSIDIGAHLIVGLPGESEEQLISDMKLINRLGINFIKFHQLQIYRHTPIADEWRHHPERFMLGTPNSIDLYTRLMTTLIRHLDPKISIERMASTAPRHLVEHSPLGGLRPDMVRQRIIEELRAQDATQGDLIIE